MHQHRQREGRSLLEQVDVLPHLDVNSSTQALRLKARGRRTARSARHPSHSLSTRELTTSAQRRGVRSNLATTCASLLVRRQRRAFQCEDPIEIRVARSHRIILRIHSSGFVRNRSSSLFPVIHSALSRALSWRALQANLAQQSSRA